MPTEIKKSIKKDYRKYLNENCIKENTAPDGMPDYSKIKYDWEKSVPKLISLIEKHDGAFYERNNRRYLMLDAVEYLISESNEKLWSLIPALTGEAKTDTNSGFRKILGNLRDIIYNIHDITNRDRMAWTYLKTDKKGFPEKIYVSLGDRFNLKITEKETTIMPNGKDNVVLLTADEFEPFKLLPLETLDMIEIEEFIEENFHNALSCDKDNSVLIFWTAASYMLQTIERSKPIIRALGKAGSGKSRMALFLSNIFYNKSTYKSPATTPASLWLGAAQDPICLVDNLENENATQDWKTFFQIVATGGMKEKVSSSDNMKKEKSAVQQILFTNGINGIFENDVSVNQRTITIEFDNSLRKPGYDHETTLMRKLKLKRDEILSYLVYRTQYVLKIIRNEKEFNKKESEFYSKFPDIAKIRMKNFLFLVYLMEGETETIPRAIQTNVIKHLEETQDSNQLVLGLDVILTTIETTNKDNDEQFERLHILKTYTGSVTYPCIYRWSSRDLHICLTQMKRQKGLNYDIDSPRNLTRRIKSEWDIILKEFEIKDANENNSKSAVYTISRRNKEEQLCVV